MHDQYKKDKFESIQKVLKERAKKAELRGANQDEVVPDVEIGSQRRSAGS